MFRRVVDWKRVPPVVVNFAEDVREALFKKIGPLHLFCPGDLRGKYRLDLSIRYVHKLLLFRSHMYSTH